MENEMKSLRETLAFDEALLRGRESEVIEAGWDGAAVLAVGKLPSTVIIAVHPAPHHGDEIFSVALLMEILDFLDRKVQIIQTRDPREWGKAHLVVDVGEGLLDHHRARAEAGVAACTRVSQLIYQTVAGPNFPKTLWEIYDELQKGVAAVDTGVTETSPFPWIRNACQAGMILEEDNFLDMVERVKKEMEERILVEISAERAEEAIKNVLSSDDEVLIFPAECRWGKCKEEMWRRKSRCVYYVSPEKEEWRVLCAADPDKEFSALSSRRLIPEKFRSLTGKELSEKTGIPGGVFSHAAGFIAGFATKEGAEAFARLCLES